MTARRLFLASLFAGVAVLAACSVKANVPREYQGAASVRLTMDRTVQSNLCQFWLTPRGGAASTAGWLGVVALAPGQSLDFKVKPQAYRVKFSACMNGWSAMPVVIDATEQRGTEIVITPQMRLGLRSPGFTTVYATAVANAAPVDTGGGEAAPEDPQEEPQDAPAASAPPSGGSCKPNGAESSLGSECCSGKTNVIARSGTTVSVCCGGGPRCQ